MLTALRRVAGPLALAGMCLVGGSYAAGAADPPDPSLPGPSAVEIHDAEWSDARRKRVLPVRIRVPNAGGDALPVVLFSHGLGGSREGGGLWGEHWASHGYLVVHLQHPGSDEALWKEPQGDAKSAKSALRSGATPGQFTARVQDVRFALDEIARRRASGDPVLARADLSRVGMSGHSFGSVTTLALVGQRYVRAGAGEPLLIEPRIRAAIAFSPNARERAGDPATQFGSIRLPVLMLTGTRDGDVLGDGTSPESRTKPFEYMPPPGKVLAVFDDGDHMVFGGHALRRAATARDREIQSDVKALTLAFWNAHLRDDRRALAWLQDGGARSILSKGDRYETKP